MSRRTFSEDVVFVNKTSANFGSRSRREAYQINSHINGNYARWKRKENALHHQSKSKSANPSPDPDGERAVARSSTTARTSSSATHSKPDHPKASSSSRSGSSSNASITSPREKDAQQETGHLQVIRPQSILRRGNSDPFDSTVIPMTALNVHCHKLAREFQVGSIWGEETTNVDCRSAILEYWLGAGIEINVPATMQGLLAWCYTASTIHQYTSHLEQELRSSPANTNLPQQPILFPTVANISQSRLSVQAYPPSQIALKALEYKTTAIQGLQQLVRTMSSDEQRCAAYECMLFLAATEWTAANVEAVLVHMKSAAAILRSMGGFEVLPHPKKESSLWMFVNVCFHFPIRPLVRPQEFDPGPLYAQKTLLRKIPELRSGSRQMTFRSVTGTVLSTLAGSTLIPLWEAISEAQRAVELIRHQPSLSTQNFTSLNRWLFLRKLTTRVRLEHLWHDLKLLLDDSMKLEQISRGTCLSQRHLYLWQICMCMGTRIFDGLVFDKSHPGDDLTMHWAPYFGRYLLHLDMLEKEEAKYDQSPEHTNVSFHKQCHLALLWLYFMGAAVECLIFRKIEGSASESPPSPGQNLSCTQRFKNVYASADFDDTDIARTFEEDLLFSADVVQDVLGELTHIETDSVNTCTVTMPQR